MSAARRGRWGAAVALILLLPALAGPGARAQEEPVVIGIGSSYPEPVLNRWANDLYNADDEHLLIDYTPVGSQEGRHEWLEDRADFALTDLPFTAEEAAAAAAAGKEYAYAPVAAGGLVFAFKLLDSQNQPIKQLKLSPMTIALIFTGRITSWTDERIAADNGVDVLPVKKPGNMLTFTRSDPNGTTWALSSWIKQVAPEEWKRYTQTYGLPDAPVERWPAQAQANSAGSPEVMAQRMANHDQLIIGYLPPHHAASYSKLSIAEVKNASGNFVMPTSESTAKGLAGGTVDPATHILTPNYNAPDPGAYPVTMVSYAVAPLTKAKPVAQKHLAKYLQFAVDHPEAATERGYALLPSPLVDGTKDVIAKLNAAATATTTTTTGETTTTTSAAAATTTTSAAAATTTTTAAGATSTTLRATAGAGQTNNSGLGATLADTGPSVWKWLLPLAVSGVLAGEAARRRRRV